MTIRVVGAGLGRTGTHSLKVALEQLLGEPCYHMIEVFAHPEHVATWHAAALDEPVDWAALFADFGATVDWPGGAFWREISAAYPDAIILLSTRDSAGWWKSADNTIFAMLRRGMPPEMGEWATMVDAMLERRFGADIKDRDACIAAYERHNADVRANADPVRLVEWHPGDGWEPLCTALGVEVPDQPFPHVNSTDDFRAMAGLDAQS
jgi:hypothetical protein